MAIPKIKATYSLDPESVEALEELARRWGVPKSEALRRVIRAASELEEAPVAEGPLDALDRLQEALGLDEPTATRWTDRVRRERRASSCRVDGESR